MSSHPHRYEVSGFTYDLNGSEDCEWTITEVTYNPGWPEDSINPYEPVEVEFGDLYRTEDPTKLLASLDPSISPADLRALKLAAAQWLFERYEP